MALSLTSIFPGIGARSAAIGTCLICNKRVLEDPEWIRLRAGARVHRECATYRMRQRDGGPVRRSRDRHDAFTGE